MKTGNSPENHRRVRTSALLTEIAAKPDGTHVQLGEIIDQFGVRAFGILLIFATLVSLIPAPAGPGALSGGLVLIVGAQLLLARKLPWLPQWLRRKKVSRSSIQAFLKRFGKSLEKVEKLCQPRLKAAFQPAWLVVMGLLMVGQGLVLMLPIPFTNIPLALVVGVSGIALIEDDGSAWLISGFLMLITIAATLFLAENVVGLIASLLK